MNPHCLGPDLFIGWPVHIQFDLQIPNFFVSESGEGSFLFLSEEGTGVKAEDTKQKLHTGHDFVHEEMLTLTAHLRQHVLDDMPMDVCQTAFEAIVIEAKAFMVQAE